MAPRRRGFDDGKWKWTIPISRRSNPDPTDPNSSAAERERRARWPGGLRVWLATAFGAGYAPIAPGTVGSAVGVCAFLVLERLGPVLFGLTLLALVALGVWASEAAEVHFGRADDGRIVIDEVAGQLIALAPLAALPGWIALRPSDLALLVTGFVAFRLFDIWKPGPVGWAEERFEGGLGVMADDVVAGAMAAIAVAIAAWGASDFALPGGRPLA